MPLVFRDVRDVDEEPLTGDILEAGLDDAQLHGTARVNKKLRKTRGTTRADLPPYTLAEVDDTRPDCEPPALIPKTVLGRVEWERLDVIRASRVAHEASSSMRIQTDHEEER